MFYLLPPRNVFNGLQRARPDYFLEKVVEDASGAVRIPKPASVAIFSHIRKKCPCRALTIRKHEIMHPLANTTFPSIRFSGIGRKESLAVSSLPSP
jgi:hypothetical protein